MRTVLHVGCGQDPLPEWLDGAEETRLDIDPAAHPHIVADMRSMGDVGHFDMVLCQHALEHLYPHEVVPALVGFRAALNDGGGVVVMVPDLEDVRPTNDVLMVTPAGPVTGLDMIYGFRPMLRERPYMAHHSGFTQSTLEMAMREAGFTRVECRRLTQYNLMGAGTK